MSEIRPGAHHLARAYAEVPESAAGGDVAATYSDIRRVHGTSSVALVYRVLATTPGRLERVWERIAPNLRTAEVPTWTHSLAQLDLGAVEPLPARLLLDAGLDAEAAVATLAEFRDVNSLNLLGLLSLVHGAEGGSTPAPIRARGPAPRRTLPMADLAMLSPGTARLLDRISAAIVGGELPILIPSLLRCFAQSEQVLELVWRSIAPAVRSPEFATVVDSILEHARASSGAVPFRVVAVDDLGTLEILARFCNAIPRMIVAGALLERTLSELLAPRSRNP